MNEENKISDDFKEVWDLAKNYTYPTVSSNDEAWENFKANMPNEHVAKKRSLSWVKYAAAAVLVAAVGLYIGVGSSNKSFDTYSTIKGEFKTVELIDGSIVNLGNNTTLKVSKNYGEGTRDVEVEGQAKFIVVRNETCPFVVASKDLITTVLGTSFDVRNDVNRIPQVVVHTGKVKVQVKEDMDQSVTVFPSQSVDLKNKVLSKIINFDYDNWNGSSKKLSYTNATLAQIQLDVLNASNVKLNIKTEDLERKFTGKFNDATNTNEIALVLSKAMGINIK